MYGMKQDWELEPKPRHFVLDDYIGALHGGAPAAETMPFSERSSG